MAFMKEIEPGLRLALVAAHGPERGLEAAHEALVWCWEHWDRTINVRNPGGYLYRIGMRRAARMAPRREVVVPVIPEDSTPWVEPVLGAALEAMTAAQRQVVILVAAYGWSHREAAELLGVSRSTIQTHLERGLGHLRIALGVGDDA